MPQIIIRGMDKEDIKKISTRLVDELQNIIGCPRDYFTIEALHTTLIMDGDEIKGYPFVQVNWFDRGQEVQNKAAEAITKCLNSVGYDHVEIFFIVLEPNKYYENGQHY